MCGLFGAGDAGAKAVDDVNLRVNAAALVVTLGPVQSGASGPGRAGAPVVAREVPRQAGTAGRDAHFVSIGGLDEFH